MRSNSAPRNQTNLPWNPGYDLGSAESGPLHERLKSTLLDAIRAGRLTAGSMLPPSRSLAAELGCSRWVVTEAYSQLIAQGYLEARTGSATRVKLSSAPRDHASPAPIRSEPNFNLTSGLPDLRAFPRRPWAAAIRAALSQASFVDLAYPLHGGHPRLRWVLAGYLTRLRGAAVEPDDVIVSTGVIDGVTRLCRALKRSGASLIGVEDPGWPRLASAAEAGGVSIVPLAVDEHGICVDQLAANSEIRAVIVAPAHQFPTGAVLSPSRRALLLEWAREVDGIVIEDDYDAELRYDGRPVGTLQGVDPSRVVLMGSVSKTLVPALRMGWIAAPPRWVRPLRDDRVPSPEPPTLEQLALASFIETGSFDRHLRRARQRYRVRRDALLRALESELPQCFVSGIAAGLHILLHLPEDVDSSAVVREAALRGLRLRSLDQFAVRVGTWRNGLVLGYGNLPDELVCEAARELALAVLASSSRRITTVSRPA